MAPNSVRSVDVVTSDSSIVAATAKATTIAELVLTVPHAWRSTIAPHLNAVYRVASKMCTVQNTIAHYERHKTEGSFPPAIHNSIKDPKIQFSKEFLGTENGRLAKGLIDESIRSTRKELLSCALARKNEELTELQALALFDEEKWRKLLIEAIQRAAVTFGSSGPKASAASSTPPSWGVGVPQHLEQETTVLWKHGNVFHFRAISLARSLADRSLLEKTRTLSIKKQTDVEMKDADTEVTTRDVVRDELKSELAQFRKDIASIKSMSLGKRHGTPLTSDRLVKARRCPKGQGRFEPSSEKVSREGHQERWQEKEGEEMSISAFLSQCSKGFRPWLPESYPIVYGRLSARCRLKLATAFAKNWELGTWHMASPGVFQQSSVSLPEDIAFMLAVNHKFILHSAPSLNDIEAAKERLTRTVRNRWFFRDKASTDFIPKFHVPNPSWSPPPASRRIEQGLDAALEVIDAQSRRALASLAVQPARHPFRSWTKVQEYLEEHRLLAKLTDKNLGLAVFPLDWYDTTVLQMLSDVSVYCRTDSIPASELVKKLGKGIPKWRLPHQMENYLRTRIKLVVPEFHCIPKVHKNPWALRPIVPSHSWVTTSTSEVLDHLLQPLLEHFPWVVASSKDVILQLEKVRVTETAPVWIMTGDVTSFYTNIPPAECASVIAGAWKLYQHSSAIPFSSIKQMVQFVMDNNFFGYRGQTFRQVKGLAMGTSCAPVLANIYAAYFERKARVVHREGVLLYVRYIDDILCLFQGTKEEAVAFTQKFRLGSLEVRWDASPLRKEFLDIELIRGSQPLGLRACHTRLFRKEMNRFLYIPWSSAHPSHVKKGFVKAELTRFAIICSTPVFFAEARQEFYGNLRRRGYPAKTLIEWFKQVQYDDRPALLLPKRQEEGGAPLMLSGHYNPVWDYVDVKEVLTAARVHWAKEELPSSLQEPLIRSLGRTTSLFDLVSTWNKTLLLFPSDGGPASVPC